jgi:hypothetical protein
MNQIRLYDLFRKELHLPDNKAAAFVKAVGDVVESESSAKNHLHATKEDINVLKNEMRVLRSDLELKIEQSKSDIYKAIFLSGIIQFIAILSSTLAIVKLMK